MLQYITSGESHGKCLLGILEGMPSGVSVDQEFLDLQLRRRQGGYGRGGRQKIEIDQVEIVGGVLKGMTTGAPIGMILPNKDFKIHSMQELTRPRPGHADLAGSLKYDQGIRPVLERASARETAMRVVVGSLTRIFLKVFDIHILSHVIQVGQVRLDSSKYSFDAILNGVEGSEVNCVDSETDQAMVEEIKRAGSQKDTVGGIVEVRVKGIPPGIGTYVHYERKLDGRLARGLMSLQAIKAVEVGLGREVAGLWGSRVHDEIFYHPGKGYYRGTNNAGGLEGSMTNGEELVIKAAMKPISTLRKPLKSVDVVTKEPSEAAYERSDTCAITACGVIAEAIVAYEVANTFLEKFGGDSLREVTHNYKGYLDQIRKA